MISYKKLNEIEIVESVESMEFFSLMDFFSGKINNKNKAMA